MEYELLITTGVKLLFVLGLSLGIVPFLTWFERRGSAWMQGRVGPSRVGPFGLFQPFVDAVKFLFKEEFIPDRANKFLYILAPMIALVAPMIALVTIPFGPSITAFGIEIPLHLASFDSGILMLVAFTGLEVYPIMIGGWASNNKYSTLGSIRGSSQMVSYELAMGLSLISMIVVYGTLSMDEMVHFQMDKAWGVLLNPIGALIFWIAIFAETNRLPFDIPEGEAELVAGFHTEYGAMKFALFFMAEYVAMIMTSALLATLFFGGYGYLPGLEWLGERVISLFEVSPLFKGNFFAALMVISLILKILFFLFVFVWVRWTLPRFRYDQLMDLGWKILLPLSIVNLIFMCGVSYFVNS